MGGIDLLTLIIPRNHGDRYLRFVEDCGVNTCFTIPCNGTAGQKILDLLGLVETEKIMLLAVSDHMKCEKIMKLAVTRMGLEMAGSGIAFTVPLDAAGGQSSLNELMYGQTYHLDEVKKMDQQDFPYVLIAAISEAGHVEDVMNAARSAGAGGGTVVHAKGTGGAMARRFLGVSLADEKEMILILVNRHRRNDVMQAIMREAGIRSEAHTILFTLPVEHVEGLQSVMNPPDDEEKNEAEEVSIP